MKELFKNFPKLGFDARNLILVDTCFLLYMLENNREKELLDLDFAMTSFNVEELDFIHGHLDHNLKHHLRGFFQVKQMPILIVPASPGQKKEERVFADFVDPVFLKVIHDPSDAVLIAAAARTHSSILTRDKHHLFTTHLENLLMPYDIRVYKELKDLSEHQSLYIT